MELTKATAALAALGQPTRLAVFRLLVEAGPEGRSHGEVGDALGIAPATLSFHLKELGAAGLIEGEQQGRSTRYRVDFAAMNALIAFLMHNCCGHGSSAPSACGPPSVKGRGKRPQ